MIEASAWLEWTTFGLSGSGAVAIFVLSAVSAYGPNFKFFPPPSKDSWQHGMFLGLFRLFLYPLIALTIFILRPGDGNLGWGQILLGGGLLILGFGLAFRITLQMGWRNAFGEKRGLMMTGWFARSRNPIYVATWVGLIGWGLVAADLRVSILLAMWALMYWLAPRFEEPWLEREYGDAYRSYKARTRRFL